MTPLSTALALRRLFPSLHIADYGVDFDALWRLDVQESHVVVVWADTPADASVRPVNTDPHVTPFDWAIAACTKRETLRVTIIDLRGREREGGIGGSSHGRGYPALRWFRTQRPESVPWLRRLTGKDLADASSIDSLVALLEWAPLEGPSFPLVLPKDALRTLPVCNVDFTEDADHHAISNLVGPLLLIRHPSGVRQTIPDHRKAIRMLLRAAGSTTAADEVATEPPVSRSGKIAALLDEHAVSELRLIVCDDQWNHGWVEWLCERTGAMPLMDEAARPAEDGAPALVAKSERLSIWVSGRPEWLLKKIDSLTSVGDLPPLERALHLTAHDESFDEVLALDLRLFAARTGDELAFQKDACARYERLGNPVRVAPLGSAAALTVLPRLLSFVDPLLPILLFSSTSRRDVAEELADLPNVVTSFAKPRLLGRAVEAFRSRTEASFDRALKESVGILRRRRVVRDLQVARKRLVGSQQANRCRYIGIYIDESGSVHDEMQSFVTAAIVAMYPDHQTAKRVRDALKRQIQWRHAVDETPAGRAQVAASVRDVINRHGVTVRSAVLTRGERLPQGPSYGPNALWANTALDRVHRLLLTRLIGTALAYVVRKEELAEDARVGILTDVRSVPVGSLRLAPSELLKFGIEVLDADNRRVPRKRLEKQAPEPAWKWAFLDTSGVHPMVEDAFSEDARLRVSYRVAEARACKGLFDGGHPLVEWADYLSNAVFRAHRGRGNFDMGRLESWAAELLEPPSVMSKYDDQLDRLVGLSCQSAEGHAWRAVDDLATSPDLCAEKGPTGLADRCRASIATDLEHVPIPRRSQT